MKGTDSFQKFFFTKERNSKIQKEREREKQKVAMQDTIKFWMQKKNGQDKENKKK